MKRKVLFTLFLLLPPFAVMARENEIFESDLFNPFSHNEGRNFK